MIIRHLTGREQRIFIVCLAMIFISVGYHGVIKPLERKNRLLGQEVKIHQIQLDRSLKVIQKAAALEEEYNFFKGKFRQPKTGEQVISSILSEIEEVAGKLKLHIADVKPQKVRAEEYSHRFSISLTMDNDFIDIIHFLYILQKPPHLFDVEEVHFDKTFRRKSMPMKTRIVLSKIFIPSHFNKYIDDRGEENIAPRL